MPPAHTSTKRLIFVVYGNIIDMIEGSMIVATACRRAERGNKRLECLYV